MCPTHGSGCVSQLSLISCVGKTLREPAKKPLLDDAVLCYELPTALIPSRTTDTQGLLSRADFNPGTS